jgi:predicted RNase H-like HicB family nuclease
MKAYTVIYEWAGTNYSAYVPDLPGCVTTGKTLEETKRNMREAIELYVEMLAEQGDPMQEPRTRAGSITVAA